MAEAGFEHRKSQFGNKLVFSLFRPHPLYKDLNALWGSCQASDQGSKEACARTVSGESKGEKLRIGQVRWGLRCL